MNEHTTKYGALPFLYHSLFQLMITDPRQCGARPNYYQTSHREVTILIGCINPYQSYQVYVLLCIMMCDALYVLHCVMICDVLCVLHCVILCDVLYVLHCIMVCDVYCTHNTYCTRACATHTHVLHACTYLLTHSHVCTHTFTFSNT